MPKQYLPEYKNQIIIAVRNGLLIADASQRYQVAQSTLYRWIKEYKQTGNNFSITDYTTLQ